MIFDKKERTNNAEEDQQELTTSGDATPEERIVALEAQITEANDMVLRRTAELENMRRRHQNERTLLIFEANKRLITELLPTIDDLERTLSSVKPEEKNPISDGIELVYKNFLKVLEAHNVHAIDAVGEPFDVELHDALMEEARSDIEAGTITTEVQKGYRMNDTVLRHSKVIVAKGEEE